MQKICAIILLSALVSNQDALPQTKWSRPIRNPQGQLTRERRQFPFGEWIPLSQPCPTCRPFADPLDIGLRGENIGLTPPRPPTVTRQIHSEGNFFPQDESSILSVPPPPPSTVPRHPSANFQFSSFAPHFNAPLPVPQAQQIPFLPQTFVQNQPLLVNGNQPILPGLNPQGNLFGQDQQQINNGKVNGFNSEFKTQKIPENVVLEQNRQVGPKQGFSNKPQPFAPPQQNHFVQQQSFGNQQQTFGNQQPAFGGQQQSFGGQQQSFGNQQQFGNSILTPPPAPRNVTQDIVIPGLDKEEIQLLYVPVETLRQRGTPQEQLLTQQPQNGQFINRGSGFKRPVNNVQPTEQPKGHFVTQNGNSQRQTDGTVKVTQSFPTSATPSTVLLQHLPFQQTPQPFVSATPATPTVDPFVTPASVFQKFSSFTPETTLPHLSTVPNTIQFSQSEIEFGTTPKTLTTQSDIVNGKSQFSGLKNTGFTQGEAFQQPFTNQQQTVTLQPHTVFTQEQQKETLTPTHFPHQIDQQRVTLQKQQENQRLLQQQRQNELEEQRVREQQRKQKELEEQRLLQQQRRQKELEQQRFLQKQKELEEQRLLQQRQKELEQQRFAQKQKELEEQRLLQQRQKELEEQRYLQQQRQKELEEQRFLQEQRQKELETQRRVQLQKQRELEEKRRLQQKQRELEEKRRLQQKQREEEQRLLRFQQQQKEAEQQKLLQEQELQRQKQENYKKFQIFKQQHQQQQQQLQQQQQQQLQQQQQQQLQQQQQALQQPNRHVLPANDKLNFIPELEKESEPEDQQLVPHQPPLSVFFKGSSGADARITDVLRELRSSNTITVLDQYFEKMPKVFVGPAGLIAPPGYEKFELPYLSNLESNRIERRIGKLPFFVAPLNFVPPPGYAKIPFPAPHVGSVVVSSESNPAMTLKSIEKGSAEIENISGGFPVVGPELPGLINNLDTETTTLKPVTYVSTPSLPQTTAQLRNRRPNNSIYKPQSRKPITRTRTTTIKPEEEVTQPLQKVEPTKDSDSGLRKPFNRFLNRRRPQAKTTTEAPLKSQQDGKNFENRYYSVDAQEKNQVLRTQQKSDVIQNGGENFEQYGGIDRITPSGHGVFEVRPTAEFPKTSHTVVSEEGRQENTEYADVNLQSFEDGPLPTGSAKTITQELYRPNSVGQSEEEVHSKTLSKPDSTASSVKYPASGYESSGKFSEVSPTASLGVYQDTVSEAQVSVEPTSIIGYEKHEESSERYDTTEPNRGRVSFTPGPTASGEQQTKGYFDSNEHYTSAFAEISKPHHIPGFVDSSRRPQVYPTQETAPQSEEEASVEVKPTSHSAGFSNKFPPTGSSNEQYLNQHSLHVTTSQVSPTVPTEEQYAGFSVQPETNRHSEDERIGSFINVQDVHSTAGSPVNTHQYSPSSTAFPSQATAIGSGRDTEYPIYVEESQPQVSSTAQPAAEVTANPSIQTYTSAAEALVHVSEPTKTDEGHGQEVTNNLSNDHRLKLPNPSIVRVRTRVRGKTRGQVNFAASQSTTPASLTRSGGENRQNEYAEQESTTKSNFREYNPVKTKFNQYRGVKKPVRTTTEAPVEYEQKTAGVYTIRPPRRPLNPSTVSTKRIRRPTTPLPSAEAATEAFGISTTGSQPQSEHSDISPSGVSNDVYFEQSSLSPVKHKFRKHFGSADQKNDVVPAYLSTAFPSTAPTYSTHEEYSEESKDHTQTEAPVGTQEKYPEWNPSESGFDVSGIVLTTARTPGQEEQQPELEEPKKPQDSKKAFDPDLEKKTGRRRIRVRVHKRPHENFETAESQNLRTVANVLVPPTTTYKPNDETSYQQLAKNVDFSFGGQKLFGSRSREYFRKRLNLTQSTDGEQPSSVTGPGATSETIDKTTDSKIFVKKAESLQNQSNDSNEGSKVGRPKFRGFVRKIIKHGVASKEADSESNQVHEKEGNEGKHESTDYQTRQTFRGGFNHTRVNGTRHKTLVRFVKKNKVRPHETETVQESSSQEPQKEEQESVETHTAVPVSQETSNSESQSTETQDVTQEKIHETQPEIQTTQQPTGNLDSQQPETTFEPEDKETQQPFTQTTQSAEYEVQESSSQFSREPASNTPQPATPQTHLTGLFLTQRPKFYQTLRPVFSRPTSSGFQRSRETESTPTEVSRGFQRSRETESTTAQSTQEERRVGYSRYKYGKTTNAPTTEKSEEVKKVNEQQIKNKNLHTLEVRKYLRTKNREGAFSQFSKNKYFSSEKILDDENTEKESGEITTERAVKTSSIEPKTTQAFVASTEVENETTENEEESELRVPTTEAINSSEEENSEEDITSSFKLETTTETEIPTTDFHTTETPEKTTEPKTSAQTTETVEAQRTEYEPDIYRFSKNSFSFDEAEKFTGTKNRAHVRNITTDIIESTASFSAPGVEKRPDIRVVTHRADEVITTGTESNSDTTEKTEAEITESGGQETTTDYPETETVASTDVVTKAKVAKVLKTSTTTKISHETEICYRGKCIRTKSENPDEDLKLLVDSASTMKIEKKKT